MQSLDYKYLKKICYKTLSLWDVKRYGDERISFKNAVKLYDVLSPYIEPLSKEELFANNWRIISKINFAGDLFLRDINEAKTFSGNLFKVIPESIIYSKINVRHGCIYYHPVNATPFGVSSEYPVYQIDLTRALGQYLVMVIQSDYFKSVLSKKTTGISKARVKSAEFLDIEIPLPDISIQNALLAAYNSKIQKADNLEQEANNINDTIDNYIIDMLGVSTGNGKDKRDRINKFLEHVRFKDILRWDVYNETPIGKSEKFNSVKLSNIIVSKPQYGAGYSSCTYNDGIRYIRITDINEDGTLNEDKVSAKGYSEKYLLEDGDFLIARSGNTVGKTFLYRAEYGKAIFAGYLIKFKLDQTKINPDYLLAYTKCSVYKKWIKGNMRVSAQPNINSKQYLDSPIVLPPLDIQAEIVKHVHKQREKIRSLNQCAQVIRQEALKEFETKIFE